MAVLEIMSGQMSYVYSIWLRVQGLLFYMSEAIVFKSTIHHYIFLLSA